MAYEDTALTDQPDGSRDQRGLVSVGHEATHQLHGKPQERGRFFLYKFAVHRSRTNRFPIEDMNIPGDVIARGQRS